MTFGAILLLLATGAVFFRWLFLDTRHDRSEVLLRVSVSLLLAALIRFLWSRRRRTALAVRGRQAALRASEERLLATLRSIGDSVICTDAESRVTSLNPAAQKLTTGWTAAEAWADQSTKSSRSSAAKPTAGSNARSDTCYSPAR